jgi:putative heme-binding domain-containing protein
MADAASKRAVQDFLLEGFPETDRDLRWEQVRLLGHCAVGQAFGGLLSLLEAERDYVTQFHVAQAIARLPEGWQPNEEMRLLEWFLRNQKGWFSQFSDKGVEFPDFWATVLSDFGKNHRQALLSHQPRIDFTGQLGGVAIQLLSESRNAERSLIALYRKQNRTEARVKIVGGLRKTRGDVAGRFLREEYGRESDPKLRGAILLSLSNQAINESDQALFRERIRHEDPAVVRASLAAFQQLKTPLDESLAHALLERLNQRRELFHLVERTLVTLAGREPAGFDSNQDVGRRPDPTMHTNRIAFWTDWYAQQFGRPFQAAAAQAEKSDEQLRKFLLSTASKGGDPSKGRRVYETLQCVGCHGGIPGLEGRIFGPDLSGVMGRLTREEFADAIVYPSKQVADRFKAVEVLLKGGEALTGFITDQNESSVTLVDRQQVHQLSRKDIQMIAPQASSLMPDHLLNRLSWDEVRDLVAFIERVGAAVPVAK